MSKRIKAIWAVAILVIVLAIGGYICYRYNCNHINKIQYDGRTYSKTDSIFDKSSSTITSTSNTGKKIYGKEVYAEPNNPNQSINIFLKEKNGEFTLYSLIGGPWYIIIKNKGAKK